MADALPAIGGICLDADNPDVDKLVGSTFAISDSIALTAFHCIGDRDSGTVKNQRVGIWFHDRFLYANVVDRLPGIDVAVLEIEEDLPDTLTPVSVASATPVPSKFTTIGWPASRPFSSHYLAISGEIVNAACKIFDDAPALQLYCVQAQTLSLHGYSGAPVLVGGNELAATGLIRWNPQQPEAPDLAIGGTVYATPISAILKESGYLQSIGELVIVAKEPEHGYCISHSNADLEIARWIGDVLRQEGLGVRVRGEYVRPGMNYIPLLREAHEKYSDMIVLLSTSTFKCDSPSHKTELELISSGEIPGDVIPVRIDTSRIPDFIYHIEPVDLRGHSSEDEIKEALLEGLAARRHLKPSAPSFPADRLISKKPTALSRSRLPRVTLADSRRIEGGA
ncbi:TIR domain-containing protein [Micromonospora sp. WMMD723]|uniref:TIR domain-containing protein n=1 Tax=unclassified Micromonospora TaxID=2617518 RepID=UPI001198B58F|nr:TIR domain-containing protein [Micromonospora sp. HM134]QDY06797.1 TIR domain-containing protein [Micromonospora sp. HM134]